MKLRTAFVFLTAASCLGVSSVAFASSTAHRQRHVNDPVIYSQPNGGSGNAYSSQNDTTGGNGNFATAFDNFTLGGTGQISITDATWFGQYFNPPVPGAITKFTLMFYTDNGGIPNCSFQGCGGTGAFATVTGNGKRQRNPRRTGGRWIAALQLSC